MMLALQEEAVNRAKDILRRSRIRDLQKMVVECVGNDIALHGHASSFYHKQLAQELIRQEVGDLRILNHVQVVHPLPDKAASNA
jgi:hypothetical protein